MAGKIGGEDASLEERRRGISAKVETVTGEKSHRAGCSSSPEKESENKQRGEDGAVREGDIQICNTQNPHLPP